MIEQRISAFADELLALRHDFHAHPELCFQEFRTSGIVARELRALGFEVAEGVAGTGVVGTIRNGKGNRAIAIRADMDALPFVEETNLPHASKTPGVMHACGHDGHTAMLLGLAKYLARHKDFDGTVHLVFQPAEEDISGAHRMIAEGLFEKFPVDSVFALHNLPGVPVGEVRVRPGAITAAVDIIDITVRGIAGHGALPHLAADSVVAASAIVMALQTAISRINDALDPAVLTVGSIHGGTLATAIPETVTMKTGLRTTSKASREKLLQRIPEIIHGQAASFGCKAELDYGDCIIYPVGINDVTATEGVRQVAIDLGQDMSQVDLRGPLMFSEDFAFMLEKVPGCYFGIGNGQTKSLHDTGYDFNDALLVPGTAFWARLVEKVLPLQ
ncbi:MAG: amidohydrolase [Proteobacteria bacterium]|nr:amidohydrolase [Pseudomonadota bacterium]